LVRFVVIGEGRPAKALLDALTSSAGASVDALVLKDPDGNPLAEDARKHGIALVDVSRLVEDVPRPAGGWLINANSTTIIPADVLNAFEGRSLNFHPGLLPEYAGLHTHQWAIRNGEREFGVTVHRMEQRIDTGVIVGQSRFPIKPEDTGLSLFSRCLAAGADLFPRIISQIVRGEPLADTPQDLTRRKLYRHRDALDGRIDWRDSAQQVVDFIRAGNYEPLTSPTYVARLDKVGDADVEVLRAAIVSAAAATPGAIVDISDEGVAIACGDGSAVRIVKARSGRRPMTRAQWEDYVSRLSGRRLLGRSDAER
jgi:UDP-4-amino-4-deoxy-L-arabinose formyltransferase/UDP-glucuronic acid dehydrogenase (UDP-4-keto-hexauronic acid decarboxylating)